MCLIIGYLSNTGIAGCKTFQIPTFHPLLLVLQFSFNLDSTFYLERMVNHNFLRELQAAVTVIHEDKLHSTTWDLLFLLQMIFRGEYYVLNPVSSML